MAPAHRFHRPDQRSTPVEDISYPLRLVLCQDCQLVQLGDILPAEILDEDDPSEKRYGEPGASATGGIRLMSEGAPVADASGSVRLLSQVADLAGCVESIRRD